MKDTSISEDSGTVIIRWFARLLALGVTALFVYAAREFGSSIFPALDWGPQGWPLLIGLIVAVAGLWLAWRWEMVGGLMAVVGGAGIMVLVCAGSGADMLLCALLFALPILVTGSLYLACCWRSRAEASAQ